MHITVMHWQPLLNLIYWLGASQTLPVPNHPNAELPRTQASYSIMREKGACKYCTSNWSMGGGM